MSTATVPLDNVSQKALENLLARGYANNKAAVIRKAIKEAEQEAVINDILISEKEIKEGKLLSGNLKKLVEYGS